MITACLAVGQFEALPEPFTDMNDACDSLNAMRRRVVREFNPLFRDEVRDIPAPTDDERNKINRDMTMTQFDDTADQCRVFNVSTRLCRQ